jgi:replicative DNA helicase
MRQLPHDIDLERSLIASCLLGGAEDVLEHVGSSDFYYRPHIKIMESVSDLIGRNLNCDLSSVGAWLRGKKQPVEMSYLASILDWPISINTQNDGERIVQLSALRQIASKSNEIYQRSFDISEDPIKLVDEFQSDINKIVVKKNEDDNTIRTSLLSVSNQIDEKIDNPVEISGVDTGYNAFNWYTCGLQPTDYIIMAARPSMGKTALALNLMINASKTDVWTDFYSYEMSRDQLIIRLIAMEGAIQYRNLQTGRLTQGELNRYKDAAARVYELKGTINYEAGMTAGRLRRLARKNKKKYGTGLIIIDYIQLMPQEKQGANASVTDISRELKLMAGELNVPVIALSQLNRNLENRPNKIPTLSDLRDSGSLEQDADLVIFPYRPAVYFDKDKRYRTDSVTGKRVETNEYRNILDKAEIYISKQRNGPTGMFNLKWVEEYSSFTELSN